MPQPGYWGKDIAVETTGGRSFRMYADRPRRIESFLSFADHWPDRPYVIQGDTIVTRRGLQRACAAKAAYLRAQNIKRGDHVFILGWNSPDWIVNFWACLQMGAVPVLGNSWWSQAELADALALIGPAMILADRYSASKLEGANWNFGNWAADENVPSIDPPSAAADKSADFSENDPAAIIFTSGTSGRAKAVVLPHRALLSNQMMLLHVTRALPYVPDEKTGDVALHTGPLFHIGGLQALMRAMLVGNTLVFGSGRFDAGDAIRLIEKHKVARWSAVPTMATRILEHPDLARHDVSSLSAMTLGGSVVTAEFFDRVRQGLPSVQARIATGYGLSENGGQATTAGGKDTIAKPGTCGRAMPLTEIRIVPLAGMPDGEIWIRSPTQMLHYYGLDETPIDPEGWLHTGDLGRTDQDGFLWITGRSKDIIIRGGENIAPPAVEAALTSVPGVREAVVFGVPHAELGEEVMAVVVVEGDISVDDLKVEARNKLASFAIPTLWRVQKDPLQVNLTGKVDKPGIRATIMAERETLTTR